MHEKNLICPYCNKESVWCENKVIYRRNFGASYMIYFCEPCDAYVGCHGNSRKPLGTMADKETRKWRQKAHRVIDIDWRQGKLKRGHVYAILREELGYEVHVGASNVQQCQEIIRAWKRRSVKSRKTKYINTKTKAFEKNKEIVLRVCLRCNEEFSSISKGNRLCLKCNKVNQTGAKL